MKLSYQVYTADTYPVCSPDGSQIIVCGHERGLLVIWQGDDVTQLELPLGTAVHHLAFPLLPQISDAESYYILAPALLQQKVVVGLACADNSVRLLTLPLAPPQNLSSPRLREDPTIGFAGRGTWGEQLVTLAAAHQRLPRGVALAFAPCSATRPEENDGDSTNDGGDGAYDILVASHSADLSGMLLVHRIPLSKDGSSLDARSGQPFLWRSQPLASPASCIDFYVPRSSKPPQRPRLLAAESSGAVRIFECCTAGVDKGRWTLSLHAPMNVTVLSARWVMNGKAIVVLTSLGDLGIWNLSITMNNRSIPGNNPTPFAISSHIGSPLASNLPPKSSASNQQRNASLAPMTPSTRKMRQEALFSASTSHSTHGGISVKLNVSLSGEGDESLVIWHGGSVGVLPSVLTYWQTKQRSSGNPFTNSATGVVRELSVATNGESRTSVSAFSKPDSTSATSADHFSFLIGGERSLTILARNDNKDKRAPTKGTLPPPNNSDGNAFTRLDQGMLARGDLSLDGLDRVLDGMREQEAGLWSPTPGKVRKTVGFR